MPPSVGVVHIGPIEGPGPCTLQHKVPAPHAGEQGGGAHACPSQKSLGALQVTPRVCYTSPTSETQKTDSFVEVDEITLDREIRRIFTGWMFSDSPGLNAVEHPVYDVWLKGCKTDSAVPAPAG